MNRRKFLTIAVGAAAAAAAGTLGIYEILKSTPSSTTSQTSTKTTSVIPSVSYPLGNRSIVILRGIGFDASAYTGSGSGAWGPHSYTGADVLNWLSELNPTTSYRYTGIVRSQDAGVLLGDLGGYPKNDNSGWTNRTVLEFLQAYVDTMKSPVAVFPRLSWNCDGNDPGGGSLFMSIAQQMFQFQQMLNPPFAMLSIDNFNASTGNEVSTLQSLYSMGWKGLSLGACGCGTSSNPNVSKETWGFLCLDQKANLTDPTYVNPNLGEQETKWDVPGGTDKLMSNMSGTDASGVAAVIEKAAMAQSGLGPNVHLCYPIYQSGSVMPLHAMELTCATAGNYWKAGDTLLKAISNMMNAFNS